MEKRLEGFLLRLKNGPGLLLLGQDYLKLESGQDPFLEEVLKKYGGSGAPKPTYDMILHGDAQENSEPALAWMQQRCERFSPPNFLETISSYAWNGVFTTAIDSIWLRAFRLDWRDLFPIYEEKVDPTDPRNKTRLHCTFLFGSVNRADESERPPLNLLEYLKRKHVALGLAKRIPSHVTPLGTLVIEGYAGNNDWLKPEDLYPILDQLNSGQVHLFNVSDQIISNDYFKDLLKTGKLTVHPESLAKALSVAQEEGFLQLGQKPQTANLGRRITIKGESKEIPLALWNQVSRSARILDDLATSDTPPLSPEQRYGEFRNFLWHSSSSASWQGYNLGFAFEREYEPQLRSMVLERLSQKELQTEPIILHGQTGTGKTVALGALAFQVHKSHKIPVLYLERRPQRPIVSDLDAFCKWAEDAGESSTLLIWDAMADPSQYYELLRALLSRGRKVVLVGSCYKLDDENRASIRMSLEAPAVLTEREVERFGGFLDQIDPGLSKVLELRNVKLDGTFLVALYRMLPQTRTGIRSGLLKEVEFAESEIMRRARDRSIDPHVSALSYALWKAGVVTEQNILLLDQTTIGDESLSQPEVITGLVMIPGKFGLRIPLDLLLRAAGAPNVDLFLRILDVDLFRWSEDPLGNIYVTARHPLEAKLIAQSRLGGSRSEISLVAKLIIEVKSNLDLGDSIEIPFAVDLVRNLGPNAVDAAYYAPYFYELALTLSMLREERGIVNPRLMLQEATLLREAAVKQQRSEKEMNDLLEKAEFIVRTAIEITEQETRNPKFRSALLVELGTILGSRATQQLKKSETREFGTVTFGDARSELLKARNLDPDNYYPIDVLAWTTRDLLKAKVLNPREEAEAKVDLLHAFAMTEVEDLSASQRERYQSRRLQIGSLFSESGIEESAFQALVKLGSKAGYYLRARSLAGELAFNAPVGADQSIKYSEALVYLQENRKEISKDFRCMYFLLRLWWMVNVGKPMFYGERETVPFDPEHWIELHKIVLQLKECGDSQTNPSLSYLQGIAEFHLGDLPGAFEVFRNLEREAEFLFGKRRIIRSYLASEDDGTAKKFHGSVARLTSDNSKGEVYVEEIRRPVTFFPRDFGRPDIRRAEPLDEFHIAFNFLGPIADPLTFHKGPHKRRNR